MRNRIFTTILCLLGILVLPISAQVFAPPRIELTPEATALILEQEGFAKRPEWPKGYSGITWGYGYDGGYYSRENILSDWRNLYARERLAETSGITGQKARAILPRYVDIVIDWSIAKQVFEAITIPRYWQLTKRTFPGFEELCPNAQGSLVSLVYNRGSSLEGDRRKEMREIYRLVPKKDYAGIAQQLKQMTRVWMGTDIYNGMKARRYAEAALVETCL